MKGSFRTLAIVNADDLGINAQVNERIFGLMALGRVTSATIIANAPSTHAAVQRVHEFPHCSFGVHLNVSEFAPLEGDGALDPILGDEGRFQGGAIRRVPLRPALVRAVQREFDRQISRIRDWGVPISHLDSHHHVHTIPGLFSALKSVQKRHGIPCVRISRNVYRSAQPVLSRIKKQAWNTALRHVGRTWTTELFCDLATFLEVAERLRKPASVELMVHPGHPEYFAEEALLEDRWWADLPMGLELISYHRLKM